ncbi:MAG TPA: hypothetical protein VJ756_11110 [Terriglobales bacterium]|nr:hypothetical protein [Terriglobales bacterium]
MNTSYRATPLLHRGMLPLCMLCLLFAPKREPAIGKFDLLLANHIVEVFALDLPPATHVRLRQNMYDLVVIALEDSTLTLLPAEGMSKDVQLNSGEVRVLRSFSVKELANNSGAKARFIVVALKSHGVEAGECGCSGEVERSICGCSERHLPQLWALSIGGSTLAGSSLPPGEGFVGASYRDDSLLISLTRVQLQDEQASGPDSVLMLGPGEVKWLSRGQRQFKNVGSNTARFITIEF